MRDSIERKSSELNKVIDKFKYIEKLESRLTSEKEGREKAEKRLGEIDEWIEQELTTLKEGIIYLKNDNDIMIISGFIKRLKELKSRIKENSDGKG
jgi:hypothetical protein